MLSTVKKLLKIADDSKDALLTEIINLINRRLSLRLGVDSVPEELQYIVVEASVARFNKIGDEGMNSYSQEGESISYSNMFAEFEEDIAAWKDRQGSGVARKGGFKFL